MGMLKLVDRSRLGRGEINSYKFESYYPYLYNLILIYYNFLFKFLFFNIILNLLLFKSIYSFIIFNPIIINHVIVNPVIVNIVFK